MLLRRNEKGTFVLVLLFIFIVFNLCMPMVFANDLNGVGSKQTSTDTETIVTTPQVDNKQDSGSTNQPTTQPSTDTDVGSIIPVDGLPGSKQTQEDVDDLSDALGGMFNKAGPDAEAIEAASTFIAPFAKILNKVMAVILGLTSLGMMFITILDLLYMGFPPVRDVLDGGRRGSGNMSGGSGRRGGMGRNSMMGGGMGNQMGGGMMGGGMMGGGMQGQMGGGMMGGGQPQNQQSVGGGLSSVGRWVSDEAISACMESQGGGMQGQMNGQGAPIKSMLFSYMKKRIIFLVLFGICVVLFSSTVFTDLGLRIGTWFLKIILGFGG